MESEEYTPEQVLSAVDWLLYQGLTREENAYIVTNVELCQDLQTMRSYRQIALDRDCHVNSIRQKLVKITRNIEWVRQGAEPILFRLPIRLALALFNHGILTVDRLKEVHSQPNGLYYLEGIGEHSISAITDFLEALSE